MIPVLPPALERHGQLALDAELRAKLLAVSPATIDRLLSETRIAAAQGRRRRAGFSSGSRRSVPVRTPDRVGGRLFGDWGDPPPGFVEVDFVAHSGVSAAGAFVREPGADRHRDGLDGVRAGRDAGGRARAGGAPGGAGALPVPAPGGRLRRRRRVHERTRGRVAPGSGAQGLEVTRSRAYRKNDRAWVEQKNGAIVRRLVGYGRFEGQASAAALARLYAAARLHTNLFQPSFKLREKTRAGARVTKRWHPPATPADRALASGRDSTPRAWRASVISAAAPTR